MSEVAISTGLYDVIPDDCIACGACSAAFGDVFEMPDGEKAFVFQQPPDEKYNPRAVLKVCPTAAITFSGELPPEEEASAPDVVEGWELEWEAHQFDFEEPIERYRRYGMDRRIVDEEKTHYRLELTLPSVLPNCREKFMFGLADHEMANYALEVKVDEGGRVRLVATMEDEEVRWLCGSANSFPHRFQSVFDLDIPVEDVVWRLTNKTLEIVAFKVGTNAKVDWKWDAYYITENCTGCTACLRRCPTEAISGEANELHIIDPEKCIDCGVCGLYCPVDAILTEYDEIAPPMKYSEIPKAKVDTDNCTGCDFCVDVCPFDCISLQQYDQNNPSTDACNMVAVVDEKKCVSCKLCEQVCIKDAITVDRPVSFPDIGWSFQQN